MSYNDRKRAAVARGTRRPFTSPAQQPSATVSHQFTPKSAQGVCPACGVLVNLVQWPTARSHGATADDADGRVPRVARHPVGVPARRVARGEVGCRGYLEIPAERTEAPPPREG